MNLEQIKYFLVLGKYLNFTKTAQIMYTTQPTVSRQIRMLEEELGFKLVERDATPLKLTSAGEYIYPRFKEAYELIDTSIKEVNGRLSAGNGSLQISCLISLNLDDQLTYIIQDFQDSYPKVNFSYEKQSIEVLSAKLEDGSTDIAITLEPRSNISQDNTEQVFLFDSPGICIYSKEHPISGKNPETLYDFRNETFVCLDENVSHRGLNGIYKICQDYGFSCKNVVRVPNIDSALLYVKSCQAVALLDKTVHMINDDCFNYIDIPESSATLSVIALWKKENSNPMLNAFLTILSQSYKKYAL